MGKKQQIEIVEEDANVQTFEKKSLSQYLPRQKFIKKKNNIKTKKMNEAIKFIKFDKNQIKKASLALIQFAQANRNPADLFGEEGFIYLEIDVSRVPEEHSVKPTQIKLPKPIYSKEMNSRMTIISTDPQADFTDKIADLDIPTLREVIGYQKIKKNFKQLKDKHALLAANDLFFCDWRIYNLLRQPLGKLFY